MWIWDIDLHALGFRRKSERYWQCSRAFGLNEPDHLSVFSWSEQTIPTARGRQRQRFLVELTEFHVTLLRAGENLHFYYHEHAENEWHPGGHTSPNEVLRAGCDPEILRARADAVARELVGALAGVFIARSET